MTVSVCMATHNGARFLGEQIDSILVQLDSTDELIVVDDASTDNSASIAARYSDRRIRLIRSSENRGVNGSFAHAIGLAIGTIIMLADQDDIWVPGRLARMREALLSSGKLLVSSNQKVIDASGEVIEYLLLDVYPEDSDRYLRNLKSIFSGKCGYYGCAMAFRRELVPLIMPLPEYVESHDLWIAIAANLARSNLHLSDVTLFRRIHGKNASLAKRPLRWKVWSRIVHARSIMDLWLRIARQSRFEY